MLFYNVDKLKTEFIKKAKAKQEELTKSIHVLGFSLDKIPPSVKLLFAAIVFAIIALAMLVMLRKVATPDKRAKVSANPDKKKK
jgi:hypothetical protein